MPLSILLPMVIVGIAGITLLLHLLNLSRPLHFPDEAAARAAWLREFPDVPVDRVILCKTCLAALIETNSGPGVVWAMGADSTARFLTGARATARPNGVMLSLPDFTAPQIFIAMGPDEKDVWLSRLADPEPQSSEVQNA